MKFNRYFSVQEANDLLPHILSVFEKIHALHADLAVRKEDLDRIHSASPGNGGTEQGIELVGLSEEIGVLLSDLGDKGVMVKDMEAGLVDFPHMRDEREVFLCWKMGERTVGYWHELDSGFRGRQAL